LGADKIKTLLGVEASPPRLGQSDINPRRKVGFREGKTVGTFPKGELLSGGGSRPVFESKAVVGGPPTSNPGNVPEKLRFFGEKFVFDYSLPRGGPRDFALFDRRFKHGVSRC